MIALRIPRHLLAPALLLVDGTAPASMSAYAMRELEEVGILRGGSLRQSARCLLGPLTAPDQIITIAVRRDGIAATRTIWRRAARATLGSPVDETRFAFEAIDTALLTFHVVGLAAVRIPAYSPDIPRVDRTLHDRRPPPRVDGLITITNLSRGARGRAKESRLHLVETARGYAEAWGPDPHSGGDIRTPRSFDDVLRLIADLVAA